MSRKLIATLVMFGAAVLWWILASALISCSKPSHRAIVQQVIAPRPSNVIPSSQ